MGDQSLVLSSRPKGPLAGPKNDTAFMYKCLGTWGFSPKPLHWRRFQVTRKLRSKIYSIYSTHIKNVTVLKSFFAATRLR